jgi:hypothetical protein
MEEILQKIKNKAAENSLEDFIDISFEEKEEFLTSENILEKELLFMVIQAKDLKTSINNKARALNKKYNKIKALDIFGINYVNKKYAGTKDIIKLDFPLKDSDSYKIYAIITHSSIKEFTTNNDRNKLNLFFEYKGLSFINKDKFQKTYTALLKGKTPKDLGLKPTSLNFAAWDFPVSCTLNFNQKVSDEKN